MTNTKTRFTIERWIGQGMPGTGAGRWRTLLSTIDHSYTTEAAAERGIRGMIALELFVAWGAWNGNEFDAEPDESDFAPLYRIVPIEVQA